MIGIQAMSVIANETGNTADAANYSKIAHDYINKWQNLAINMNVTPAHTTLAYGDASSHGKLQSHETILSVTPAKNLAGLLYNLFADAQLGLNLVPQYVYQMQSDFYPTVANKYGVPLDTRHTYTKGEFQLAVTSNL